MNSNRRGFRLMTGIGIPLVAILALVGLLGQHMFTTHAASGQANGSKLKNYQHVFVIMMENTSYTSLIGNSNAPGLTRQRRLMGWQRTILA